MKTRVVKWHDARAYGGHWIDRNEKFEAPECITVGYLVSEDKRQIVLAQSFSETEYLNIVAIPKAWVVK